MKRIEELKSHLNELAKHNYEVSKYDLLACINDTVDYLDEVKDIRLNSDAKKETRRLIYKIHNRLCINNES